MFSIDYELTGYGWADVRISNGEISLERQASYLGEPLEELLDLASFLVEEDAFIEYHRYRNPAAYFTGEPFGMLLKLVEPLAAWEDSGHPNRYFSPDIPVHLVVSEVSHVPNQIPVPEGAVTFDIRTTASQFAEEVFRCAGRVIEEYGFEGYRRSWMNGDFPVESFARLGALLGKEAISIALGDLRSDPTK